MVHKHTYVLIIISNDIIIYIHMINIIIIIAIYIHNACVYNYYMYVVNSLGWSLDLLIRR